jgi:hypothetical protein
MDVEFKPAEPVFDIDLEHSAQFLELRGLMLCIRISWSNVLTSANTRGYRYIMAPVRRVVISLPCLEVQAMKVRIEYCVP